MKRYLIHILLGTSILIAVLINWSDKYVRIFDPYYYSGGYITYKNSGDKDVTMVSIPSSMIEAEKLYGSKNGDFYRSVKHLSPGEEGTIIDSYQQLLVSSDTISRIYMGVDKHLHSESFPFDQFNSEPILYLKKKIIWFFVGLFIAAICMLVFFIKLIKKQLPGNRWANLCFLWFSVIFFLFNCLYVPSEWNYLNAINSILAAQS